MRILYVSTFASAKGGIEANVLDTARGLAALGHEVALAHADPAPEEPFRAAFGALYALGTNAAAGLRAAVAAFRPSLVYLHKTEDAGALGLEGIGRPTVRMVHDHDLYCQRRHRYLPGNLEVCTRPAELLGCLRCGGFVERRRDAPLGLGWRPVTARLRDLAATRRMSRVLVASRFMADELARNAIPEDIVRVVPLGVPDAGPPTPVPDGPEPPLVLYLGQILRTKGLDLLIRALATRRVPWRLAVVGDGPQAREFRALAERLGLVDRIEWRGRLAPEEVAAVLREAAIVAVPSRWPEPFGLVGLEAMRAARPVAAFASGAIPEWLADDETGLLAPAGDTAALGDALGRLLVDPGLRARLGTAARAAFLDRFTMARYLCTLVATLREAVECM